MTFWANAEIQNNLPDSQKKKLGHNLSDILIGCTFDQQPCNIHDFVWKYDNYFGNCFEFNSGKWFQLVL